MDRARLRCRVACRASPTFYLDGVEMLRSALLVHALARVSER